MPGGAKSGAVGAQSADIDPDLQAVIDAWAGLSEAVRRRVLAMIRPGQSTNKSVKGAGKKE